jgi:hypothetical protein
MPHLEPSYLRYIYDGLEKGDLHPDNAAALPEGLTGLYEAAFEENKPARERQKLLETFAIWALLKKEVSAQFVAEILDVPTQEIVEFIANYSNWFSSPESGKYQLYHERLKVYLLQKISEKEIEQLHNKVIFKLELAIAEQKEDEFEIYGLEFFGEHLFVFDNNKLISITLSEEYRNRQILKLKSFDYSINNIKNCIQICSLKNKNKLVLKFVKLLNDLYEKEINVSINYSLLISNNGPEIFYEKIKDLPAETRAKYWIHAIILNLTNNSELTDKLNYVFEFFNNNENNFFSEQSLNFNFIFDSVELIFEFTDSLLDLQLDIYWFLSRVEWQISKEEAKDGIIDDWKKRLINCLNNYNLEKRKDIFNILKKISEENKWFELYRSNDSILINLKELEPVIFSNDSKIIKPNICDLNLFLNKIIDVSDKVIIQNTIKSSSYVGISSINYRGNKLTQNTISRFFDKKNEFEEYISKLLAYLNNSNLTDFNTEFQSFIDEIGGFEEDDIIYLSDEIWGEFEIFFRELSTISSPFEFSKILNYIVENFSFGIYNEYLGSTVFQEKDFYNVIRFDVIQNNLLFYFDINFIKNSIDCKIVTKFDLIATIAQLFNKNEGFLNKNVVEFLFKELGDEDLFENFSQEPYLYFKIINFYNLNLNYAILQYKTKLELIPLEFSLISFSYKITNKDLIENYFYYLANYEFQNDNYKILIETNFEFSINELSLIYKFNNSELIKIVKFLNHKNNNFNNFNLIKNTNKINELIFLLRNNKYYIKQINEAIN